MNELLLASTKAFADWLGLQLPKLGANWWVENVVQRLTFQQQRSVEQRRIDSLTQLDLAALLRVLDQSWHEIAAMQPLAKEARTWVKELMVVRNRWAHAPSGGLSLADAYRDADTLSRVLLAIGAGEILPKAVSTYMAKVLQEMAPRSRTEEGSALPTFASPPAGGLTSTAPPANAQKFAVGQLVGLRSNPAVVLPVLEAIPTPGGEVRYRVFENGTKQVYYETQLVDLQGDGESRTVMSPAELSAYLTAVQLFSPNAASLYSINAGRIRFVPYQYRPVFKLIQSDRPRLLVADEVGVGKTIEAGLILKELQARNDIKSVLIICPKALVAERKWELELKRFDENFVPLDGSLLRHCMRETHLSGEWPMQYEKAIVPFSLFDSDLLFGKPGRGAARAVGLLELDPPPKFDLVIVDEAHHIRNTDTLLHQAVRYFCDNAEAVVFLSATPVQLGREDLFTLLNVLRPDVIIDPASFEQMAEPNRFINEAIQACRKADPAWTEQVRNSLRSVAETEWGRGVLSVNPGFQHIYDALVEDTQDGSARIRTIQALEDLYTFSSLINRTRRRDIGEFTTRRPETVSTEFTPSQRALHDDLLSVISRILARLHGNQNVRFMMTTVSRQAASSLYGLVPTLQDILQGKLDRLEAAEAGDADDVDGSMGFVDEIGGDIRTLIERARQLDVQDPKAEAFMRVIKDKLGMPRNKTLVFSTFRHTLAYLAGKLTVERVRYGLVHGGIGDEERSELRRRFAFLKDDPLALDVLLSSEVGCEGLDFQFCDCLINYDLPWNPMRIEQRIGRIDRYGQQSEKVAIFNFITPGTIDAVIYDRCLYRIGVFHHAIGGGEEILGDITRELHSIGESFTLSEDERSLQLQQLADNKVRQVEEERKLEERQGELFGLNLAAATWEDRLEKARSHWLEPAALIEAVSVYLKGRLGREQDFLLGEKALRTLRLGQEARAVLLEDYRKLTKANDPTYRAWERWLKGTAPTLAVTFERDAAVDNADAVLLTIGHPLLRQAAGYSMNRSQPMFVKLRATKDSVPVGIHPFALYRWQRHGARQSDELIGISDTEALGSQLLEYLRDVEPAEDAELPEQGIFDALDAAHHRRWLSATTEHAEDNRQLVGVRIQSLTASQQARRALLDGQLAKATNDKIRTMKRAELERANADFDHRVRQLRQAAESGDIKATPIVFGVLQGSGS